MSVLLAMLAKLAVQADYPHVVQSDIEYSREMCRSLGEPFKMHAGYVEETDFNNDGVKDYILDTRAFECGRVSAQLFNSRNGTPLYVYVSKKDGELEKVFNAYVFEYELKRDYNQLPHLNVWIRGEVGYQVVYQRLEWTEADKFEVVDQDSNAEVPAQLWKKFD